MTTPGYIAMAMAALLLGSASAAAGDGETSGVGPPSASLDGSVERLRAEGRVLSAETQDYDSRSAHVIRLLTPDGRVKRYYLDPRTGQRLPPPRR